MDTFTNYLGMGGYARFVWSAYGVTVLVLLALLVDTMSRVRRRRAELARLEAEGKGRPVGARGAGLDDA